MRRSPSLPQVQHKDRSIRRARAHLVTARVPTHLHITGYIKVWLTISVADPDPGWVKIRIRIRDEQPGSYFRELRNNFLGVKILNSFDADPGFGMEKFRSGMENRKSPDPGCLSRIRNTASYNWFLKDTTVQIVQRPMVS